MKEDNHEAGRFYTRACKQFDRWFYSHDRATQDEMRRKGILPYREMKMNEYVFPVNTESQKALIKPIIDPSDSTDDETFYSRDRVAEFTRRLLDTLEYSHSPEVRLHFQLVRIALRDHRAMSGEVLAKLYGMTRAGINFRVQRIRGILAGTTPSKACQDVAEKKRDGEKRAEKKPGTSKTSSKKTECCQTPSKESLGRGGNARVAPHPGKKTRGFKGKRRGC